MIGAAGELFARYRVIVTIIILFVFKNIRFERRQSIAKGNTVSHAPSSDVHFVVDTVTSMSIIVIISALHVDIHECVCVCVCESVMCMCVCMCYCQFECVLQIVGTCE